MIPNYNIFEYTSFSVQKARIIFYLGLFIWSFSFIGYLKFLNTEWYYYLAFGAVFALFALYKFSSYIINTRFTNFNMDNHLMLVEKIKILIKYNQTPDIDIFLPVCGESLETIERTWIGVKNLKYNKSKFHVYVLDDKGSFEIKSLAKKYKFNYLSRPNKGEMKKAGNIKYGLENSFSPFYIVFDADFVPDKDFLIHILGYIHFNDNTGLVQTPQYFWNIDNSPVAFGAAAIQEDFYKIVQPARDTVKGSMCVGTNAIYRRKALFEGGGVPNVDHGEDVHTGLTIMNAGYRLKYIPLILAVGETPESLQAMCKQHNRWCSSSIGLFFSGRLYRLQNLNWIQKFCYHIGFMYYFSSAASLFTPIILIYLLISHYDTINVLNAVFFFPHIAYMFIFLPIFRKHKWHYGTVLVNTLLTYTHLITIFNRLRGKGATWVATGGADKTSFGIFRTVQILNIIYVGILWTTITVLFLINRLPIFNPNSYSVLFWILYNLILHTFLFVILNKDEINKNTNQNIAPIIELKVKAPKEAIKVHL